MAGGEDFLDEGDEAARRVAGEDVPIQQETHKVSPLMMTGFLARRIGRPKCCSICR